VGKSNGSIGDGNVPLFYDKRLLNGQDKQSTNPSGLMLIIISNVTKGVLIKPLYVH